MKKKILIVLCILIFLIIVIILGGVLWYNNQLKPVNTSSITEATIEIQSGMSTNQILNLLKEEGIIKNVLASKIYIRLNEVTGLQAGKYIIKSDMSLAEVLNQISSGDIIDEQISITFLEGKNIRWIAKKISEETNNTEEQVYEVLKDKEYIQTLINKYWFLTDEILNQNIYYPLEGYLYPETYKFDNTDVSVKEIFNVMLNQTDKVLSNYKYDIEKSGGSVHQILTIASIIELEGNDSTSRKGISSVIYNRLKNNMSIGSDVTTYYAIQVDVGERDLYTSEINQYNPYNTRGPNMEGKLPVGPISTVSEDSIYSALNPGETDYLYFVADMNGKIYFSATYEEHQKIIEDLQKQGLWYEYE